MPTLSQLQQTTTPIQIKRGQISFTLNAALEKLSSEKRPDFTPSEGVSYAELRAEAGEIARGNVGLQIELNRRVSALNDAADPERLRAHIGASRGLTPAKIAKIDLAQVGKDELQGAFDALSQTLVGEIEALETKINANQEARLRNYARRLAYLVVSSDLQPDEDGRALREGANKSPEDWAHNADIYFDFFTEQLLVGCLEEVEGAVYGPLVTSA